MNGSWIVPDWPAPAPVAALSTTRAGGVSRGPFRSFNLGAHCGDDPAAVARNRALLADALPAAPHWLRQVHGTTVRVLDAGPPGPGAGTGADLPPTADASLTRRTDVPCAILTADCLPVLFCDIGGSEVAAAHAGWRGLAAGVLEATVAAMATPPASLLAWLGPAIGPGAYEVGDDVRAAFASHEEQGAGAFHRAGDRWRLDLYAMARHCLARAGVTRVSGGHWCTFREDARFFSHRRDGECGRMATVVWLKSG